MTQHVRPYCDGCEKEIAGTYLSMSIEGTQGDLCSLPCAQKWLAAEWSKRSISNEMDRLKEARNNIAGRGFRTVDDVPKKVEGEVIDDAEDSSRNA